MCIAFAETGKLQRKTSVSVLQPTAADHIDAEVNTVENVNHTASDESPHHALVDDLYEAIEACTTNEMLSRGKQGVLNTELSDGTDSHLMNIDNIYSEINTTDDVVEVYVSALNPVHLTASGEMKSYLQHAASGEVESCLQSAYHTASGEVVSCVQQIPSSDSHIMTSPPIYYEDMDCREIHPHSAASMSLPALTYEEMDQEMHSAICASMHEESSNIV